MSNQDTNALFVTASRKKYRFNTTKGSLLVDDLWDLSLQSLDNIAITLDDAIQKAGRKSFIESRSPLATEDSAKLDIVKYVISVKQTEAEESKKRAEKKSRREFLESLLERKKIEKFESLSVEEIQKQIDQES